MPQLLSKIKDAIGGALRQRLTLAGVVFSLTVLLVGIAAFASANNLLFLVLAAMLSTLLVSGFVSRLGLAGLELDLQMPEHITARRKMAARLIIRNSKHWMPSFSIHVAGSPDSAFTSELYFPVIPGGARIEERAEVEFHRRGIYKENSFRFSTRFPFGFTERRVQVTLQREVLVYPCLDPQPGFTELFAAVKGELEARQRGRGHDFYRIRPYEVLESARHVDWKATAHTGDLQVREFAREQEQRVQIVLDLDVAAKYSTWFERAIDCCAYLTWMMAQRGSRVRLRTQEFDVSLPEEGDVYTILKYLATALPAPGRPLPAPDDDTSYSILFCARLAAPNDDWTGARLLSPESFPVPANFGTAGTNPARQELHHGS
jgi:uncharacterized protein (DUF58 family)